ncbi:cysteine desulfurase family protein [Streptococcus cuniculipharyngis]|uniref:cysteine desulfurase n=1 Tax=Streptococcus cuniculipharyngis TaxID=1562651 RepID=A0A5C5SF42_9STRE|nr:cysteine desulfurase family protein [Streptococcus cuniculipharyngis]TWS98922.1 cysteine desulfurase [Streptococcus cuniculipharyngis]
MIYLDNAATTSPALSVIEKMATVMQENFANPSSTHSYGRKANQELRQCRQSIAQLLQVEEDTILFTSGGTESNNLAIKGYALAHQNQGKHIITSQMEHHSVLHPLAYLEERFGFEVTYLAPQNQTITAQQVKEALREDTILVSIMHANNETGDFYPIEEIAQVLNHHQAAFHVDAVQTVGKIPVFPQILGVDFLSASAHKFHGPKGVGFLYCRHRHFDALLQGGEQEGKRRASTEHLAGIAAMTLALEQALANLTQDNQHIAQLKKQLLQQLNQLDIPYYLNQRNDALPHILNIGFPQSNNMLLITQLDLAGIAVSAGSACTAGNITPSHVLASYYGPDSPRLQEVIRISFSKSNSLEEISTVAKTLKEMVGT